MRSPSVAVALRADDSPEVVAEPDLVAAVIGGDAETLDQIATVLSQRGWIVATAANAGDAAAACPIRPRAVIAALDLADRDATDILEELQRAFPGSPLVVVTRSPLGCNVRRALRAGASGIIDESRLEATLSPTVRAGDAGLVSVPRELREHVTRPILSHREKQIVSLVVAGATNKEIADRLYLAESTVKNHLSSVFAKLGVRSRAEAAAALDLAEASFEHPWLLGLNGDGAG